MQLLNRNLTGYILRTIRILQGKSATEAAAGMKVGQPYLSMVERDTREVTTALKQKAEMFYGESVELTEEELEVLRVMTDTLSPKLIMVAARVIEHRAKHQTTKIYHLGESNVQ